MAALNWAEQIEVMKARLKPQLLHVFFWLPEVDRSLLRNLRKGAVAFRLFLMRTLIRGNES